MFTKIGLLVTQNVCLCVYTLQNKLASYVITVSVLPRKSDAVCLPAKQHESDIFSLYST